MGRTYRESGVDDEAVARFIEEVTPLARKTHTAGVIGDLGGFAGLFGLDALRFRDPVLVAATDGVGTKIEVARALQSIEGLGWDLVAMCINDVAVYGATPLFFLDYLATSAFSPRSAKRLIEGIAEACRSCGCALLGGEIAQMPGFYRPGAFELAGFAVGCVERNALIDGSGVSPGDSVIGISASGVHANGFSLIRRIVEEEGLQLGMILPRSRASLGETLLAPTTIYAPAVLQLLRKGHTIEAMAHVTGGGIGGNLRRVLPPGVAAVIDPKRWTPPEIFTFLQRVGRVEEEEMRKTFNMGIGYLIVSPEGGAIVRELHRSGQRAWKIGEIVPNGGECPEVRWEGE